MKQRFRLYRRKGGGKFYIHDSQTGKQESLGTRDRGETLTLFLAKNEAVRQPALNLQIARTYLSASDPQVATRTWQAAMDEITKTKTGETRLRHAAAMKDKAFDVIRNAAILETQAEHFLRVLEKGTVSTNVFLRRIHNFALDMSWLPWPVIPKKRWPKLEFKQKRAITWEEHEQIIKREPNVEMRAFYQLCWHIGGSQSDVASIHAKDIDWENQVICYTRKKTGIVSQMHFGPEVANLLRTLPLFGPLFPRLEKMHEKHRAKQFRRRCEGLAITGISLHSYRYAWAERAKQYGYPERFAQQALGHSSKAVHRAYAKKANVKLPSLEQYQKEFAEKNIFPIKRDDPLPPLPSGSDDIFSIV